MALLSRCANTDEGRTAELRVCGASVNDRVAIGRLRFLRSRRDGAAPTEKREYLGAEAELERFERACRLASEELDAVSAVASRHAGDGEADIFLIHKLLLEDEELCESVRTHIERGSDAAEAVELAVSEQEERLRGLGDDYLSARTADLRDVGGRLVRLLDGREAQGGMRQGLDGVDGGDKYILVADDLSPSETVTLDMSEIAGFVTFEGSISSHTAILARSIGIPAIIGTGAFDAAYGGCLAVIDGVEGSLYIEPDADTLRYYERKLAETNGIAARLEVYRGKESVTKGGRKVKLYANIGGESDARAALGADAEGIGLLRSEFLYIGRRRLPSEDEQYAAYVRIAEIMGGKPVIIRSLDIGADKQSESISVGKESNPALGLRGIRLCLSEPELFKTQLRAICRASARGSISLMLPMIVSVDEVIATRKLISEVHRELSLEGKEYDRDMPLGIMIETPAAAVMAEELAAVSDFFSVGSNDLCQYTLAADRQNRSVEYICRDTEPTLRLIGYAAEAAHRHGIWIGVCGELAADTSLTERLISMGIDELSVSAPYVLSVREKIRSIE